MKIGWIGTGVMGEAMCRRLLEAGFACTVFNRTKFKSEDLCRRGAIWADSPREVALCCDAVFTILGFPEDVREVILDEKSGVLAGIRQRKSKNMEYSPGIVVDMTTSRPSLAVEIAEIAAADGIFSLDTPVSGGDVGAKNGTLSIMAGGDAATFQKLEDIWKVLGKSYLLMGPPGAGQHTKMVNQILIAGNMMGMCEAICYAEKVGLNPETVLTAVGGGAAGSWSLANLAPRILKGDFAPGFKVRHFVKDLKIALEEARARNLDLPGLALAESLYEKLQEVGFADAGTQALGKIL